MTVTRLVVVLAAAAAAFGVWQFSSSQGDKAADGAADILAPIADARFTVAQANLAQQLAASASYAGATMPPGATLVRADGSTFCVQIGTGAAVAHLTGPGGAAAAGPC
ncbi:MAG: hypothetical protein ACKVUT_15645 [Gaiella sp.]